MRILKIGKVHTFLVGIMMMTILLCCSSQVQAAQDESDYTYTVTDGKAEIIMYTGANSVKVVTIPSTLGGAPVTSIGAQAFMNYTNLTSIVIPQGVTSFGVNAFAMCSGLTTLSITQSVTSIGNGAFVGCSGLTTIIIPQGVTSIGDDTFRYCSNLASITIPESVTSIGNLAFFECPALTTIIIPQGVISIGCSAFSLCSGLTSITYNSATTNIYDDADTIPATTKIIGYDPSTAKTYAIKYRRKFQVIPITLQSIAITTSATKLSYTVGDTLDISGLVVTGTYSDGSTREESITTANVSGFNSTVAATDQILTITVGAKTITYKVQVVAANHNKNDWQQQRNGFNSAVSYCDKFPTSPILKW